MTADGQHAGPGGEDEQLKPKRDLAVVIVAYGVPGLLAECLRALDGSYTVTVVDNSSSTEVQTVASEAGARYLDPGSNIGFAAGVNTALERLDLAATDVLLLNPDSTVDSASIEHLRACLANNALLACVAPRQRQRSSRAEDRVAWPFPTPAGAWIEAFGFGALRRRREFVIGAVLLLRGQALVEVGGFDERFFLYAEETDWQRRASHVGWSAAVCEGVWATHEGAATDSDPRRRELRFHTGAERYIRKHHGRLGWLSYRVANVVGASARAIVLGGGRRRGAWQRAWIYACGPDRLARRTGAVLPPVPRVPELCRHPRGPRALPSPRRRALSSGSLSILLDARDVGINRVGVARVLEELIPRLIQLDPDRYLVVATHAAAHRLDPVDPARLRTVPALPQSVWEQLALPSLATFLGVDATYCHRECAALWGPAVLLHVTEDPEVRWERQTDPDLRERARQRYSRLLMDRSLQRARVVTSTESSRADLIRRHGLRSEQIEVVALGVDTQRFASSSSARRRAQPYFFCLASDRSRDHAEIVLEAFAQFRSGFGSGVVLVIAGDLGDQRMRLESMTQQFGLGGCVELPGRITDEELSSLYAGSLATICASSDEGFGLQPLEALACGSLLIASRTPAVEEVIRGAVVLWTDLQAASLADAMSVAVSSTALREQAARANQVVAARFNWWTTAIRIHGLLEELALAGRARRRRGVP